MLTEIYARRQGKYQALKETLGFWCSRAKKGSKILLATPFGNFILIFKGEFKPRNQSRITYEEAEN